MRSLLVAFLLAIFGAVAITVTTEPEPLERRLVQLQFERVMPEAAEQLDHESAEVQALMLAYADDPVLATKARLALLRYPDLARPVFLAYGDRLEFQNVLRRYGEDVVLPIHYFTHNEVFTLEMMRGLSESARAAMASIRRLWDDADPSQAAAQGPLTAEDRGAYAIQFLEREGYDFLGQFVLNADADVRWVQTERVLEGLNHFFAGGIRGLESKFRRDEPIAVGDIGWAALDVAVGASAFKILRMGRVGALGGRSLTFSERSAALAAGLWRGSTIGARLVKYGAPAVLAYVAIRHPSVINSLLGSAAESLGVPVKAAQLVGWTLVLLPVLLFLRLLLRPLVWVFSAMVAALRWSDRALREGRRGHMSTA